jgi:hypothetical protein
MRGEHPFERVNAATQFFVLRDFVADLDDSAAISATIPGLELETRFDRN